MDLIENVRCEETRKWYEGIHEVALVSVYLNILLCSYSSNSIFFYKNEQIFH